MALLKKLTVTGTPADGTTVTNSNTNTTPQISSPSTMKFQSAKAMGAAFGIEMVQSTSYTSFFYLDLDSGVSDVFVGLHPFRFEAAPSATNTMLRFYPTGNSGHTTNLGGFLLTTTRRLQFLENGTGGLNITSDSGTPMTAATDYIAVYKLNLAANTMEAKVFPRGSSTALFTISGNLAADMAAATGIQYLRFGIATASTGLDLSTNSEFAVGDTDYLSRYDIANVAPTCTLGAAQTTNVEPGQLITLTAATTDSDGTSSITSITQTAGSPTVTLAGSGNTRTFIAPATLAGTTPAFRATATDDDGATTTADVSVTILPASWRFSNGTSMVPAIAFAKR